jgi:hypothetical protein
MYDGTDVDGPAGVRAFLLRHQDQYLRNVTQNLMTYALGRGMDYRDMPEMRAILRSTASDHYKLKDLVEAIATSDLFRMNTVPGATPDGDQSPAPEGDKPKTDTKTAALTPAPSLETPSTGGQ